MATIRMVVRESGTGNPVENQEVEVRTVVGDSLLDTLTTDANGIVEYNADGSPGPIVMVTDSGTGVRKTSGQNLDQMGTYYLADVPRLLALLGDGVVAGYTDRDTAANDMALSPGTGRRINVGSGAILIDGVLGRFTGTTAVDIAENSSGATRYDLLVAELTREGETEEGQFVLSAVTGTSTTTGPALTKTNAARQVALGLIRVVDGATSFVSGDITDLRYSPTHDQAYVQLNPNAYARSASYENGDLLYVTGGKLSRLPKGTDGQALVLASGLPAWGNLTLYVTVQEGDVTVDAAVTTLDFDPDAFDVSSSPAGEANITIAAGGITNTEVATGIDAAKLANGSVSNTEFQYLNGVTSAIQTQFNGKSNVGHTHTIANISTLQDELDAIDTALDGKSDTTHVHESYPTLFGVLQSDTARQVTGTLATMEETTVGPLVDGVTYDIELDVDMRASLDSGSGYVVAYARIGSESSVSGTRTGTLNGERTISATATVAGYVGTGASLALYARAQMSGGTDGSVSATTIRGRAIPRSVQAS